uniref:Inositol 1,4,5-triphosphate receptor associated 2 n=1 Tax=Salvator merianae TaxID=96440 RepID=A0A8D0BC91_SALMN
REHKRSPAGSGHSPSSPASSEGEEFLRLSLGFKCDLFTLEKRVRLEERSRDLAEANLRKEIAGALKLLNWESLMPLEDNQAQEIVKKLQKSLELLNQYAMRVASKAEMLGAIHQESRVSKAVEVMIQHVENLKRTYAREHAELEELKEVLLQNDKYFGSLGDRGNEQRACLCFDRGLIGAKQGEKRPLLKRYVSSPSWTESEEEQPESTSTRLFSWASSLRSSFGRINKGLYMPIIAVLFLAVLSAFIVHLSLQRPADDAPVGTGDAWTSVQQLLWPYTGLQHQRPPPV